MNLQPLGQLLRVLTLISLELLRGASVEDLGGFHWLFYFARPWQMSQSCFVTQLLPQVDLAHFPLPELRSQHAGVGMVEKTSQFFQELWLVPAWSPKCGCRHLGPRAESEHIVWRPQRLKSVPRGGSMTPQVFFMWSLCFPTRLGHHLCCST